MATNLATAFEPAPSEPVNLKESDLREIEYPVQLAYTREPVMSLTGTITIIRPGRRDLALSETEWQDLGLPELSALEGQTDDERHCLV